jgi:hypothetical protein
LLNVSIRRQRRLPRAPTELPTSPLRDAALRIWFRFAAIQQLTVAMPAAWVRMESSAIGPDRAGSNGVEIRASCQVRADSPSDRRAGRPSCCCRLSGWRRSAVGWAKAAARFRLMNGAGSAVPTRSHSICRETSRGHGAKERLCPPYRAGQRPRPWRLRAPRWPCRRRPLPLNSRTLFAMTGARLQPRMGRGGVR